MLNLTNKFKWLTLLSGVLLLAGSAVAQDSGPLIDLLVKKGLINDQEGEELRADLARDASAAVVATLSGGKSTAGLSIAGRIQIQYAGLATDISGTAADPVSTSHFFLRRIYLGAKANLGMGWTSSLNYDFAGSTFDEAKITWTQSDALAVDIGFRKVPFGLEEWYTSSGSLKAIERSPGTRYFVEGNNGRRLGAGSYRIGLYAGGKGESGLFYNVAVTNPERDESAAGVAGVGSAANNNLAYWANVGFKGKSGESLAYVLSASVGILPDQGGKTLGAGDDLTVYNVFADFTRGNFDLQLEYFGSDNQHGISATRDSKSSAYSIQPALKVGEKFEYAVRYTYVDSDGRGVNLSDGIRSAPGGGTMDNLSEWYAGLTYFFRGNDVKWQIGYIAGESNDTITGGTAKAKTSGVRSQMQVNF
ncbi:MAG: porin [Opitutaceae bacterium]|nr:porin [Opitutaceae bacterium]MBP9911936.1 porin [Opitutaceae bacterium]